MSELDDFLTAMLDRQIAAETAIHNGDVEPRMALWSRSDPVTLLGAMGMSNVGWDAVGRTFRWVASRFSNCTAYSFELLAAGACGDLAYTVGFERADLSVDGGPPQSTKVRVTHVYRREGGEWKIVHRHGDYVPLDATAAAGGSPAGPET
ncbi:ketosteroid isomerase-like protein [Arthrobacter globiformis]|uniref:YybH family protein n=1 Tax=Arthrobacter globiformis TaxID=1665 RepID=UPI00278AE6BC|nr:nuclear transport factor 2 family protein [Arthrobacter globiformis]MDQ1057417.1 ketosteroid isomerase-like protein [Arthrobacter globiformis]